MVRVGLGNTISLVPAVRISLGEMAWVQKLHFLLIDRRLLQNQEVNLQKVRANLSSTKAQTERLSHNLALCKGSN